MTAAPDLRPETSLRLPPEVHFAEVGDEAVLVHLERGLYYGLDAVGTRTWALLAEGRSLGEVQERLVAEYEVSRERLWADLVELVGELLRHGLVEVAPAGPAP